MHVLVHLCQLAWNPLECLNDLARCWFRQLTISQITVVVQSRYICVTRPRFVQRNKWKSSDGVENKACVTFARPSKNGGFPLRTCKRRVIWLERAGSWGREVATHRLSNASKLGINTIYSAQGIRNYRILSKNSNDVGFNMLGCFNLFVHVTLQIQ